VLMPAPHSVTGEEVVELHCHGGVYLVRRVLGLAMARGARMAERGEFTRRAFLNGQMDLTEAEAVADLVAARGDGALGQALAQLGGALAERVRALRGQLVSIRAHLEAEIDFSDEGLKLPSRAEIASAIDLLSRDVGLLHHSFARGRLLREGARAAIVGKPNVGKSSILNLLVGIERAIVTSLPGTTRDVIEDSIQLGPYPLVLWDTAGLREGRDEIERIGIERTHKSLAAADLVLAVFDASRPLDEEDRQLAACCRGRTGVALLNKCDLPRVTDLAELAQLGLAMPVLRFSAPKLDGIDALKCELLRAVESVAGDGGPEAPAISRERHRAALARALDALSAARQSAAGSMPPEIIAVDIAAAAEALGRITGEVHSEDVLEAIFSEFCIGK
jgi:tRNA modification GTPase